MGKKANWHKAKHGLITKAKNIFWSESEKKTYGEKNVEKRRGKEIRRRKRKRRRREEKEKGRAKGMEL